MIKTGYIIKLILLGLISLACDDGTRIGEIESSAPVLGKLQGNWVLARGCVSQVMNYGLIIHQSFHDDKHITTLSLFNKQTCQNTDKLLTIEAESEIVNITKSKNHKGYFERQENPIKLTIKLDNADGLNNFGQYLDFYFHLSPAHINNIDRVLLLENKELDLSKAFTEVDKKDSVHIFKFNNDELDTGILQVSTISKPLSAVDAYKRETK